jgi:hypothetical protein
MLVPEEAGRSLLGPGLKAEEENEEEDEEEEEEEEEPEEVKGDDNEAEAGRVLNIPFGLVKLERARTAFIPADNFCSDDVADSGNGSMRLRADCCGAVACVWDGDPCPSAFSVPQAGSKKWLFAGGQGGCCGRAAGEFDKKSSARGTEAVLWCRRRMSDNDKKAMAAWRCERAVSARRTIGVAKSDHFAPLFSVRSPDVAVVASCSSGHTRSRYACW